ncbi:M48 family metallopeptidase [Candidatus Micrarchaeota archaeon]|nr:M48 family metallopeptidase [Candidatus Micrarchaeota archaeon]MBU1930643.1 M48 family metallopeptidase [Candidatus Micrarchaeota archaeon]
MAIHNEISGNKWKSILLTFCFFILIILVVWAVTFVMAWGIFGVFLALFLAVILSIGSYYYSDKIVLKISKARPATKEEHRVLTNLMEGLVIAAQIPMPKLYVVEDTAPNAFATGRNPNHGVVVVTTGLLQKLDRNELEGVLAHELSHIRNYDIRFVTLVTIMVGFTVLLSDFFLRSLFWGSIYGGSNRSSSGGGNSSGYLMIIGIVLIVLAPLIATIIKLAISRKREFLADASAAHLTRYPEGLARALEKLDKDKEPLEAANKATAHLYITNPLKNNKTWLKGLFATHPPIETRVQKLRAM